MQDARLARCPERALVNGKMVRCCRPVHSGSPADRHWAAGYGWQSFGGRDNSVRRDPAPPDCLVPVSPALRHPERPQRRGRGPVRMPGRSKLRSGKGRARSSVNL